MAWHWYQESLSFGLVELVWSDKEELVRLLCSFVLFASFSYIAYLLACFFLVLFAWLQVACGGVLFPVSDCRVCGFLVLVFLFDVVLLVHFLLYC